MVSAIIGSRPALVAFYALVLSRVLPNFLVNLTTGKVMLILRLVATAMVVGGIAIIYLT